MSDNNDKKYYGGNIWQAPSYMTGYIVPCPNDKFILISNPSEQGCCVNVSYQGPDKALHGKWMFTLEELKVRLKDWTWQGTHLDYIEWLLGATGYGAYGKVIEKSELVEQVQEVVG